MTMRGRTPAILLAIAQAQKVGRRAVRAVDLAAEGGEWCPRAIEIAAQRLDRGDREAGVSRPWPTLSARLRAIARGWREYEAAHPQDSREVRHG